MVLKYRILALLGLSLVILAGCTFPFSGSTPAVATPLPATPQLPTPAPLNTFPVPTFTVTVTNTSTTVPPTSTIAPTVAPSVTSTVALVPVLNWSLIGVGCLSTTNIEITLSDGVPVTSVQSVCAGPAPCSTSSPVTYSCQLVPHKDGQVYCQGLAAVSGSPLTACMVLPGVAQPVCNTFANFQHYLTACTCKALYTDLASCNADKKCAWNTTTLKCAAKP